MKGSKLGLEELLIIGFSIKAPDPTRICNQTHPFLHKNPKESETELQVQVKAKPELQVSRGRLKPDSPWS